MHASQHTQPAAASISALHKFIRSVPEWRTTEIRVVRENYSRGGAIACRHHLPKRSIGAIRAKAAELGLRAPQVSGEEMRARFSAPQAVTPELEEMIREAHRMAVPGWQSQLAEKLGKSRNWISSSVSNLGLVSPRTMPQKWQKAELQILAEHAGKSAPTVQKHLQAAGFKRTAAAINTQRLRLGIDRHDPDTWNCGELARLTGISSTTVSKWMDLGHLKFERKSESSSSHRMVTRKQFQKFARVHIHLIDLRKVEQVWFKDVMWGTA
jgi:biotin operon repressor